MPKTKPKMTEKHDVGLCPLCGHKREFRGKIRREPGADLTAAISSARADAADEKTANDFAAAVSARLEAALARREP